MVFLLWKMSKWQSKQIYANVNIVVEWKGMLAEGIVV